MRYSIVLRRFQSSLSNSSPLFKVKNVLGAPAHIFENNTRTSNPLICIPAPSFVCDSSEWLPTASILAQSQRHVIVLSLPGFGSGAPVYPEIPNVQFYEEWLAAAIFDVCDNIGDGSHVDIAAAGHSGSLLMRAAAAGNLPNVRTLALVAPTFFGPLPTLSKRKFPSGPIGRYMKWFFCTAFDFMYQMPITGPRMHTFFTSSRWIEKQLKAHVFATATNVNPLLIKEKRKHARAKRPRRMASSFVVGKLDTFINDKEVAECLQNVENNGIKTSIIIPKNAPTNSKNSMKKLSVANPQSITQMINGALLPHEEYPDATASAIETLLVSSYNSKEIKQKKQVNAVST